MPDQVSTQKRIVFYPADIKSLSFDDLVNSDIILQIKGMVLEFINTQGFDESRETHSILKDKIHQFETGLDKDIAGTYVDLLKLLEMSQNRFLSVSKQLGYYSDSILLLYKYDLDPQEFFEVSFLLSDNISGNDKALARSAFEKNTEIVGHQPLEVEGHEKKLSSNIQNWLADFRAITGKTNIEPIGGYAKAYYFNNSKNYSSLQPNDRELLKRILDFYEWLHKPSTIFFPIESSKEDKFTEQKNKFAIPQVPPQTMNVPAPRPVVTPVQLKPVPPPAPKPVMPKVAQVPQHGQDLDVLRKQMEQSKVNFIPQAKPVITPRPETNPVLDEIKREISEKELPAYKEALPPPLIDSKEGGIPPTAVTRKDTQVKNSLASLNDIQTIEDLKKIDLSIFRQAPLLNQIQLIKEKIVYLSRVNNVIPYYAVNAFEQSPLFQVYLKVGSSAIQDTDADREMALANSVSKSGSDITIHEFERIADLREDIEHL